MGVVTAIALLLIGCVASFLFATLAYALRDFSRASLAARLDKKGRAGELDALLAHEEELALTAAVCRAACNLVIVLATLYLVGSLLAGGIVGVYGGTFAVSLVLVGLFGVLLPQAVAEHAAEGFIAAFARPLRLGRVLLLPVVKLYAVLRSLARRLAGHGPADDPDEAEEELEQEILDIVQEGREEGVIDDAERQMIERAIRFGDVTAGQAMTARPDVAALSDDVSLDEVLAVIDRTGYSRLPVYHGTLDKVVGVVYARDLFRYIGHVDARDSTNGQPEAAARPAPGRFRIRKAMRQPLYVPKTKPLDDLLRDFQLQKVHMAIVLDEYGGTAGLVTIEDVLEELVGEIADEHEQDEGPMFKRLGEHEAEADARLEVEEANRLMGLGLTEDEGFETLGGFVTTTLGHIPQAGASFEHETDKGRVTVAILEAEPQRVSRVGLEFKPKQSAGNDNGSKAEATAETANPQIETATSAAEVAAINGSKQ